MKIYKEVSSADFEFWSGARDTVKYLTDDEVEQIFNILEDSYPEGMDETEVNDFFWFEDDQIADWLGWPDFETLMKGRDDIWFDTYEEYEDYLEEHEEADEEENE